MCYVNCDVYMVLGKFSRRFKFLVVTISLHGLNDKIWGFFPPLFLFYLYSFLGHLYGILINFSRLVGFD